MSLRGAIGLVQRGNRTLFLLPSASMAGSRRHITGKTFREEVPKPKPFDYMRYEFNDFWNLIDKTTPRFDENSKIVVVEGAHAVGKEAFAKELADDLDMKYFPPVTMDEVYVNEYGDDLRNYRDVLNHKNQPFDERDFARDPVGRDGGADRLHFYTWYFKYNQYLKALRHVMNTGQGCVLVRGPHSDNAYFMAAYNQGWIHKTTRDFYEMARKDSLWRLLRPNLVIYLDAPAEVSVKNVQERGNEWEKNSPVYTNAAYLNNLTTLLKRDYIREAKSHSQVLAYDWSEPGDVESVVEDIERLNFDYYGMYEAQQKDWRFGLEEEAARIRALFSRSVNLDQMRSAALHPAYFEAEKLFLEAQDVDNLDKVMTAMTGGQFEKGFNEGEGYLFKFARDKLDGDGRLAIRGKKGYFPHLEQSNMVTDEKEKVSWGKWI